MRFIGLTLLLALSIVSPGAAQVPLGAGVQRSPSSPIGKPFARLFSPGAKAGPGAAQRLAAKIVCGMTMVPVDSSLDPKIVHPVPTGRKFTLKTVKPPMCGQ